MPCSIVHIVVTLSWFEVSAFFPLCFRTLFKKIRRVTGSGRSTMSSRWLPSAVFASAETRLSYSSSISTRRSGPDCFDLCTSDGPITKAERISRALIRAVIEIDGIPSTFRGFHASPDEVDFNLKSSLTQLGINAENCEMSLNSNFGTATINVDLVALSPLGILTLDYVGVGCKVGKLFCHEKVRRVRSLEYVQRLLDKSDMKGLPLLIYGASSTDPDWELKVVDGRVIAFLPVQESTFSYSGEIHGLLPTIGMALKQGTNFKDLLRLHQKSHEGATRVATPVNVLMVRSYAMHLRTMFGRVVDELLPAGIKCMSSNIIEPDHVKGTSAIDISGGRTFVFHGESTQELTKIPVEFFSLESYREHVSFELRKTLPDRCANPSDLLRVFGSAPKGDEQCCSFACKGSMFDVLTESDWVTSSPQKEPYVGNEDPVRQQQLAERYLFQQCEYAILSAISVGDITSDGILLTRYFPSPVLKSLLLSRQVVKHVKAIYFTKASRHYGSFFSHEDASTLNDLHTFGIPVFHVDEAGGSMYQFMQRPNADSGLLVPIDRRAEFLKATFFGVYGSNLVAGDFENELHVLLHGVLHLRKTCDHPLLNPDKALALVTGGGPGAMEVGNRVAKSLGILSCGMFVDFGSMTSKPGATINEQKKNPYVEAFMTYRPQKLVERQSDFNLDFPVFLTGGIGTDFEYSLEEVRRKVGTAPIHPLVLFGTGEHWGAKITGRFQENLRSGTVRGSEWLSNIPYVVNSGKQALAVYTRFFNGTLPIGPSHPSNDRGFVLVDEEFMKAA